MPFLEDETEKNQKENQTKEGSSETPQTPAAKHGEGGGEEETKNEANEERPIEKDPSETFQTAAAAAATTTTTTTTTQKSGNDNSKKPRSRHRQKRYLAKSARLCLM